MAENDDPEQDSLDYRLPGQNKDGRTRKRKWTPAAIERAGEQLMEYVRNTEIPQLSDFEFDVLGLMPGICEYLGGLSPRFLQVAIAAKKIIGDKLCKAALQKKIDARMCSFYLAAQHGWTTESKIKVDADVKLTGPIKIEIVQPTQKSSDSCTSLRGPLRGGDM